MLRMFSLAFSLLILSAVLLSLYGGWQCTQVGRLYINIETPADGGEVAAVNTKEAISLPVRISTNSEGLRAEVTLHETPVWGGELTTPSTIRIINGEAFAELDRQGYLDMVLKVSGSRLSSACEATGLFRLEAPKVAGESVTHFRVVAKPPEVVGTPEITLGQAGSFSAVALNVKSVSKQVDVLVTAKVLNGLEKAERRTVLVNGNTLLVTLPVSVTTPIRPISYVIRISNVAGQAQISGILYQDAKSSPANPPISSVDPKQHSIGGQPVLKSDSSPVTVIPDWVGISFFIGFGLLGLLLTVAFGPNVAGTVMSVVGVCLLLFFVAGLFTSFTSSEAAAVKTLVPNPEATTAPTKVVALCPTGLIPSLAKNKSTWLENPLGSNKLVEFKDLPLTGNEKLDGTYKEIAGQLFCQTNRMNANYPLWWKVK